MLRPDRFSVGVLSDDSGETIVRFRPDVPTELRELLPKQLIVEWGFLAPDANGLPTSEELSESDRFGSELCGAIEAHDDAMLALVATGNSVREWYFYCRDPVLLQDRLNTFFHGRAFPIELHAGHDPAWRAYSEFTSSFAGGV